MPKKKYKDRDSEILQRLGGWKQKDGSLPQFIELYDKLLRLQIAVKSSIALPKKPNLTEETIAAQLREGIPLLKFDDLSLNWTLVQNHFRVVIDTIADYVSKEVGGVQELRNLASNIPLLQQVARNWYQGLPLSSIAVEQCVSEEFLHATVQAALRPFLMAHSEASFGLVKQELWRRRDCPVCGGKPDFAFLDKESGGRWLLCSRCDAQWLFQRLECPYCGTTNQNALAYFTDNEGLYRLYTCEECKSYIKAIDLRQTGSEVMLTLERIATVEMDRQAEEAGYKPG